MLTMSFSCTDALIRMVTTFSSGSVFPPPNSHPGIDFCSYNYSNIIYNAFFAIAML